MILPSEKTEEKLTPLRKYLDTLDIMRDLIKIEMQGKLFRAFRLFAPALATLFMRELRLQKTVVEKKVLNLISPAVRLIVKKYTHSAFLAGREMGEVVLSQRIQKGLFGWKMFETKEEKIEAQKAEKRAKFEAESNLTLRLNAATQQYSVSVKQLVSEMLLHKMSRSQTQKKIGEEIRGGKRETGTYFNAVVAAEQSYLFDVADAAAQEVFACQNLQDLEKWKWVAFFTKTCPDCIERHGQVKTYKQWQNLGVPRAGQTVCRSHCHCVLLPNFYAVDIAEPVRRERARIGMKSKPASKPAPKPKPKPKLVGEYPESKTSIFLFGKKKKIEEKKETYEVDYDGDFQIKFKGKTYKASAKGERERGYLDSETMQQLARMAQGISKIEFEEAKGFRLRAKKEAKKGVEIGDVIHFDAGKVRAEHGTLKRPIRLKLKGEVLGKVGHIKFTLGGKPSALGVLHTHPDEAHSFSVADADSLRTGKFAFNIVYIVKTEKYNVIIKPTNQRDIGCLPNPNIINSLLSSTYKSKDLFGDEGAKRYNKTAHKLLRSIGYVIKEAEDIENLNIKLKEGLQEAGYEQEPIRPEAR